MYWFSDLFFDYIYIYIFLIQIFMVYPRIWCWLNAQWLQYKSISILCEKFDCKFVFLIWLFSFFYRLLSRGDFFGKCFSMPVEEIPLSSPIFSDFDRQVGCCSCLEFEKKSEKMDSVTRLSTQFSQKCILSNCQEEVDVGFYRGGAGHVCGKNCYEEFPSSVGNRPICRGIPVKETTHLRHGQVKTICLFYNFYLND